jgi:hypothetical protein
LSTIVVALLLAGFVVGAVVQDVLVGEELALLDGPVARWFAEHRTPAALTGATLVLRAVEVPGIAVTTLLSAGALLLWRRGAAALTTVVAAAGAIGMAVVLQAGPRDRAGAGRTWAGAAWLRGR